MQAEVNDILGYSPLYTTWRSIAATKICGAEMDDAVVRLQP